MGQHAVAPPRRERGRRGQLHPRTPARKDGVPGSTRPRAEREVPLNERVLPGALDRIQEGVRRRPPALLPRREAVAACAPVIKAHVDRLGRPTFHRVFLDRLACQRAVLKYGGDRWHGDDGATGLSGTSEAPRRVPPDCRSYRDSARGANDSEATKMAGYRARPPSTARCPAADPRGCRCSCAAAATAAEFLATSRPWKRCGRSGSWDRDTTSAHPPPPRKNCAATPPVPPPRRRRVSRPLPSGRLHPPDDPRPAPPGQPIPDDGRPAVSPDRRPLRDGR